MIGKGWRRLLVMAGAMLIAALALAGMVSRPSADCERVQSHAARVICERNGNIPERFLFRRFEQP